jgi:hypothetical protein
MNKIEVQTTPRQISIFLQHLPLVALSAIFWIVIGCGSGLTLSSIQSTLTFDPIAAHSFGDPPFAISASSPSKGAISYSVLSGPAIVSGNVVTLKGAGSVILVANQAPDATFGAQTAKAVLMVNPTSAILAFATIPTHTLGERPFSVAAYSSSTGVIRYSVVSGPATLADNLTQCSVTKDGLALQGGCGSW